MRSSVHPLILAGILGCGLLVSCGKGSAAAIPPKGPDAEAPPFGGLPPAFGLELDGTLRWFEFGPEAPAPIAEVLSSSLVSFEPWPLAQRSTGMAVAGGRIIIAVNRRGFLAVSPLRSGARVDCYKIFDSERFGPYSVSAPFAYRGNPSVALYRDRFFLEPSGAAPDPRAFSVVDDAAAPVPIEPAGFALFPRSEFWDIDACERSADGGLVLRAAREGRVAYAATDSLDRAGDPIDASAFRAALIPRPVGAADAALRGALTAAAAAHPDRVGIVAAVTDDGHGAVSFLLSPAAEADPETVLTAAALPPLRAWAYSDAFAAYVLFPDGLCAVSSDGVSSLTRFPVLPEGFSYTGIAAAGGVVVVTWEEQKEWSVGAAGFATVAAAAVTGRAPADVLY